VWSVGQQALEDGLTLVRIRGQFTVCITATTTIGDGFQRFGLGICIVSENAFGVGATAIPAPLTDVGWDGWMWHYLGGQLRGFSTTELGVAPMEAVRVEIDTKAMRKIKESDIVVGVIELGSEVGASTLEFAAETRMLFKLP